MTEGQHSNNNGWREGLLLSRSGHPKPLLANAITALRNSGAFHNVLAFNAFAIETVVDTPSVGLSNSWMPRAWSFQDDLWATDWLQRQGIGVTTATAAQAVGAVARDRSFHPVLDYLGGIQHDGRARTSSWLSTYLGADNTPY